MKRLFIFSDPHITPKAEFSKPTSDGLSDYLHQVERSFDWLTDQICKNRPKVVACLGDLFESTGHVETISLKLATELIVYMKRVCNDFGAKLIFLTGNHDTYSEEHRIHILEFLRPIVDKVIDKPMLLWGWLYCIPWASDIKGIKVPEEAEVCLTHLDVFGGIMDSGRVCDFGVTPDQFPCLTFNGHQHAPKTLAGHFFNVGAILSRSFRDSQNGATSPRGAVLAEVEQDGYFEVTRLVNPHERPFSTVEILNEDDAEYWQETPDGYENAYVRVKCTSKTREVAELVACLAAGARIEEIPDKKLSDDMPAIDESFSPEENFRKAVDEVMLFDSEGDRERILEYGLHIIDKCKSKADTHAASIEFDEVEIVNFQSIRKDTINLANRGLVAIMGNNGVGKSTIVEAIFWALTGVSLREYTGDDVIHWGNKSCHVKLSFFVNHKPYLVMRSRHPNKVRLWAGEEEISCRVSRDTDDLIRNLIGRSKAVLQHSVFLTSDLQTRFTALRYPDRIKLVEQITGAEIYGEIYSEVVSLLKSASQVMDKLTGERAQAANNVTKLNERSKQVTGEIVEAMRNQKQGMAELKLRLASLVDRRGVLSVEIEQVEKFEQANELAFGEMAAKVDEAARSASALERKLNQTSYIYSTTKDRLDEQIKTMDGGACPTCGQDLAFTLISVRVKEMRGELASLSNKVADIRREHSESMGVLRLAEQDLDSIPRPADLRKAREDKQQALRSLEKEIDELKAEMHKRRTALDGLKAVRKEVDEQFSSAMAELDFIDEQIETQKHELYALDWLVSAFSTKGIRAKVLSTVTMPYLNSRVERYSERFGLPVKLTNEVETKGGKIENKLDVALAGRLTYRGCSRGQKRKVDLAIQKAFNDLATKTGGFVNLLVGDEIIDPLDDEATQIFIELLREESAGKTILLMTHKKFVEADADHRMHLTLVDGETKILEV